MGNLNPDEKVILNEVDNIAYVINTKTNLFIRSYNLDTKQEIVYADMPPVLDKILSEIKNGQKKI